MGALASLPPHEAGDGAVGVSPLFTQRIDILNPVRASNGRGGMTTSYVLAGTVDGRMTTPQRSRQIGEKLQGATVTHAELVTVYLDAASISIAEDARLRYDGVEYELQQLDRQDSFAVALARRV